MTDTSAVAQRVWLALIAFAFLALAVLYNLANPAFEATDELRHFRYARYLVEYRRLPEQTGDPARSAQAHHPPLYYLAVAAATFWVPDAGPVFFEPRVNPNWGFRYYDVGGDNKNQYLHGDDEAWPPRGPLLVLFIGRLVSTLFGLGVVVFTYALARELASSHSITPAPSHAFAPWLFLPFTAAGLLAFNPMFLHLSASLNNDVPAAFFAAWALWLCAGIVRRGCTPRREYALGAALGLGLMTKTNDAALILPAGVALLMAARPSIARTAHPFSLSSRRSLAFSHAARSVLRTGILVLLVSGWWFARNLLVYGDLTGAAQYVAAWRGQADRAQLFREMLSNLPYAWTTVWGRFNFGQIPLPDLIYRLGAGALGLSAVGWLSAAVTGAGRTHLRKYARTWLVLLVAAASTALFWAALMLSIPATANARMMFPAYPALAVMVAEGWRLIGIAATGGSATGGSATGVASYGAAGGSATGRSATGVASYMLLVALAVFGLVTLKAAYARPRTVEGVPPEATPLAVNFFDIAELIGYRLSTDAARPGDRVEVTLFWRPVARTARPLTVFVHWLNPDGLLIAQRDTYPGLGNYPTTDWQPGAIFADTYPVYVSSTAYAPDSGRWRVGLYDATTGERLLVLGPMGEAMDDAATLSDAVLLANPGPDGVPNPASVNFADRVTLAGYALDPRLLAPGDSFVLTTFWRATDPDSDYWIFAHVVGNDGRIWAIADSALFPPATTWPKGAIVSESRALVVAPDTPPGLYTLEVGLTRRDFGEDRLPILGDDGHIINDHLPLTTIRVVGP